MAKGFKSFNSFDELGKNVPKEEVKKQVVHQTQTNIFENISFPDDKRKQNSARFFNNLKENKRVELVIEGEDIVIYVGNKKMPGRYFLKVLTKDYRDRTDHQEIEEKIIEICKSNGIGISMKYLWSEIFEDYIEYKFIDNDKLYPIKRFFTILEESEKKELTLSRKKEQGKERYRVTIKDERTQEKMTISVNALFACLPKSIEGQQEKDAYLLCKAYNIGLVYDNSVFER